MALTINRNQEISPEELRFIKQKFKEKTSSQAIYRCIEFVVHKVPELEKEILELRKEKDKIKVKHNHLIEIIKRKNFFDQELDNMVYPVDA